MKKLLLALAVTTLIPITASACTYENIKIENGVVKGHWIPCHDDNCPDAGRFKKEEVVHKRDAAPAKPVDRYKLADLEIEGSKEVKKDNQTEPAVEKETEKEERKEEVKQKTEKENAGKVWDRKKHRMRDVEEINTENDIINKITSEPIETDDVKKEEKKKPVEKEIVDGIKGFFGF